MGEYVWTQIVIGGKAAKPVAESMLQLLADTFTEGAEAVGAHMVATGERNYGNADDVESFCQAHGLPYVLTWAAAGGCFDSGSHAWRPGMESAAEFTATEGGDASISLPELRRDHEAGVTLAEIIARLAIADSDTLPPFEIDPGDAPDMPHDATDAAPAAPQMPDASALMLAALRAAYVEVQNPGDAARNGQDIGAAILSAIRAAEGREG